MLPPLTGTPALPERRFLELFGFLFPDGESAEARRRAILDRLAFRELAAGTVVLREGETCAGAPFVTDGAIRVFKRAESGREITLYRVEAGQSCVLSVSCGRGLAAFPAAAVAETAVSAAFMPADLVRTLLASSETFRNFALDQYAARMAGVMELVEEVAFRRVDERLRQWLEQAAAAPEAAAAGSAAAAGRRRRVLATHQELADHVGTSREVVSRILKDWEQRGGIELVRGAVLLKPGFGRIVT
jgi:CRP/FNR family transcriptional regulator